MSEASFNRRRLLLAGAGALAGAAIRPPRVLGALGGPATGPLDVIQLGALGAGERTLELPGRIDLVGLQWEGPAGAHPSIRLRLPGGRWGPWTSAGAHGHGPERPPARGLIGEPLWTGGARTIQLRSSPSLAGARLHLVRGSADQAQSVIASALARATPVLSAGPGQPPIIARGAWATGIQPPRIAPEYGAVKLGFVHHTENPNGYSAGQVPAMLRAIFEFHRNVNGWNDIGYNFVIDLYGRIWEARAGGIDEPVVGAHAGGYNLVSTGVAVLGSFTETPISSAARAALQHLLAWKLSLHGTPSTGRVTVRVNPAGASYSKYPANARVSLPRVAGHRDGDSTECPGDALYGELGPIRGQVRRLAGDPVAATVVLAPAPAVPPTAPPPAETTPTGTVTPPAGAQPATGTPAQLLVTLKTLSGIPLAGAPVLLQSRTVTRRGLSVLESTVAEGVTDSLGQWSVAAAFAAPGAKKLHLRALYGGGDGHGAAVSRAVSVAPQPPLTPPTATVPSS